MATFFGFLLGVLIGTPISDLFGISSSGNNDESTLAAAIEAFIMLLGVGAGIGFLQSLLLQDKIPKSWQWIVATSLGYASPIALVYLFDTSPLRKYYYYMMMEGANTVFALIFMAIVMTLYGAMIGFWQWLILKQYFRRADKWIMASAICHGSSFFFFNGLAGCIMP